MSFNRIKNSKMNSDRQPLLGKISLGIKLKNASGTEYPKEVDYFVVPEAVQKVHGEKPKALPCMFVIDNEFEAVKQFYAVYGSNRKMKCSGDGHTAERRNDVGIEKMSCPGPEDCDFGKQNGCKAQTDLYVTLHQVNMGGVYKLSTRGLTSGADILTGINRAKILFKRISMVPMMLVREEKKIMNPKTKNMDTHWPVRFYPVATAEEVIRLRQGIDGIQDNSGLLPAPQEPVVEGEVISVGADKASKLENPCQDIYASFSLRLEACKTLTELLSLGEELKGNIDAIPAIDAEKLREEFRLKRVNLK
jgi:hypothetical protein